jgi:hypothetical protein
LRSRASEGFGTSVSEWMRSLTTDDRIDVSKPEKFQLGTHQATRVVVRTRSTFKVTCQDNTDPFANMVTDTEIPPTRVRSGQGGAITFIDFGDDAVVIWNDGDAMVDSQSLPVIKTMRFKN